MLPRKFQIWALNSTQVTIDTNTTPAANQIGCEVVLWKLGAGGREEVILAEFTHTADDIPAGGRRLLGEVDNTGSNLGLGAHVSCRAQIDDAAADGGIDFYYEWSDSADAYPSDAPDFTFPDDVHTTPIGSVALVGAQSRRRSFELV